MPKPGVPESFKVLVKELQSLCLDIRVLDEQGEEIELHDDDDDDVVYSSGANAETYVAEDDSTIEGSGYRIRHVDDGDSADDADEDADEDADDDEPFSFDADDLGEDDYE